MCARCHDGRANPQLGKSRFNVLALDTLSRAEKDLAIARLGDSGRNPHAAMARGRPHRRKASRRRPSSCRSRRRVHVDNAGVSMNRLELVSSQAGASHARAQCCWILLAALVAASCGAGEGIAAGRAVPAAPTSVGHRAAARARRPSAGRQRRGGSAGGAAGGNGGNGGNAGTSGTAGATAALPARAAGTERAAAVAAAGSAGTAGDGGAGGSAIAGTTGAAGAWWPGGAGTAGCGAGGGAGRGGSGSRREAAGAAAREDQRRGRRRIGRRDGAARRGASGPFVCNQVTGGKLTEEWFIAGFENVVDNSRWQVKWREDAYVEEWANLQSWILDGPDRLGLREATRARRIGWCSAPSASSTRRRPSGAPASPRP